MRVVPLPGLSSLGGFGCESVVAAFIRRILSKKGEETLGGKMKTSFSEAIMGSCVINYEFILSLLPICS